MTDLSQKKVLISAYACRPHMGSEAEVGWSTAREIAQYCQVWVVTRSDNRQAIEVELGKHPDLKLQFIYHNLPWTRWWNFGVQLHYYLWQLKTYGLIRRLDQEIGFDLVHHVTYVKYWSPSFLALLPIPFIWGPVGGAESAPQPFYQDWNIRGKLYENMRNWARRLGEYDPFVRLTAQRSQWAGATTAETAERLRYLGASEVHLTSEAHLCIQDIERFAQVPTPEDAPFRMVSMGRLLHWKGFHLGLHAFAKAHFSTQPEYWIVGQGPEYQRLQSLTQRLGLEHQVKFWGQLPRSEALQKLQECHTLVHPSLHDSGGWVCLEAMAMGRAVICLDLGGPQMQVTDATGIKVPACSPQQAVTDLAEAMVRLESDGALRKRLGNSGQQRVRDYYSWTVKGQYWARCYADILNT
ncbi:glycosyltransferase [Acaryochloris sp. IP29b_bin.137]|uniref:glycosyltransferase family 4 protein n=1 Tax=Acaryochloris sp. IP29b_bin.137 TaxID=2969217 RepID=UPI002612E998|nr:glycosyltransferase [Acaryochloris sp. IP29b_bin.137]